MEEKSLTQLYHCTEYSSLCSILSSRRFLPSYCLEDLSVFPKEIMKMAYAVICFADLMEVERDRHMKQFGADSYIIMKKEWALRKSVSPIVYYHDKSFLAEILNNIIAFAAERYLQMGQPEDDKFCNSVMLLMGYLKQYEGRYLIKKTDKYSEITQFYNEREWRYIPSVTQNEAFYLDEDDYKNEALVKQKKQELIDNGLVLSFELDDIIEVGIPLSRKEDFERELQKDHILYDIIKIRYM